MDTIDINQTAAESKGIKLFTERAIVISTILGGPLAGCYLISQNFKSLNDISKGKKSLIIGILFTLIFFPILLFIPSSIFDKISNFVFDLLWTISIYFIVKRYQKENIKTHIKNGGQSGSWSKVLIISIIAAVISIVYIMAVSLVILPNDYYDSKFTNGTQLNSSISAPSENIAIPKNLTSLKIENTTGVVLYDSLNIKVSDAKVVGLLLIDLGYFGKDSNNEAAYYKSNNKYNVNIIIPEIAWEDPAIQKGGKWLLGQLNKTYPGHGFQVILTSFNSFGKSKEYIFK